MAVTKSGCDYGKGTRWALGVFILIFLSLVGANTLAIRSSQGDTLASALGLELGVLEERVRENEQTLARVDERLKNIQNGVEKLLALNGVE